MVAGGILAGTLSANAATDDATASAPSITQEEGATPHGTTTEGTAGAPEDCPEGAGPRGELGTPPGDTDDGTPGDDGTADDGTSTESDSPTADPTA